jgi:hypothetical protein
MSKLIGGRGRPKPAGPPPCPEWARTMFFTGDAPAQDSPDHAAYVQTFLEKGSLDQLWVTHRAELLREWIKTRPGTRPPRWWAEAPELRKVRPQPGVAVGDTEYFSPGIPHVYPADEERDGLVFEGEVEVEAEATYLKRLGLFLPGEQGRVKRAQWRPEVVDFTVPDEDSVIDGPRVVDLATAYARAVMVSPQGEDDGGEAA